MKIQRAFCFAAMVLITQLAVAKLPFTNDIFGKEEGTLDRVCCFRVPEGRWVEECCSASGRW